MVRNLEKITRDFWDVSHALRSPSGGTMTTQNALQILNSDGKLQLDDWRLANLMHIIRYDIIEGNTKWRAEKQQVVNTALILHMKDWTSTAVRLEKKATATL